MRLKCEIKIQMDSEKVISIFKDIDICSCVISQSLWNHFDIIHSLGTLWLHRPCAKQRYQTEDRAISMPYTNHVASILLAPKSCLKNSYIQIEGHLRDPRTPRLSTNTAECLCTFFSTLLFHMPQIWESISQTILHCPFCEISV